MIEIPRKVKELAGEGAFIWLGKAREWERETGKTAIHFEIGEPDFATPDNINNAAIKAIQEGKSKYTPSPGIYDVRAAIAKFMGDKRNVTIEPERVIIAPGAKNIINTTFQLLVDSDNPATAAILPDPGYGPYDDNAKYAGADVFKVPMSEEEDWGFNLDVLEETIKAIPEKYTTKVLVLITPSNPTGGILTEEQLKKVAEFAEKYDLFVISDEIYDDFVFDGEHKSIISLPGMDKRTVIVHGASKTWAMTGWRVGWGIYPTQEMAEYAGKLVGNCASCTSEVCQYAALEAVSGPQDEVKKMAAEYKARRDYMLEEFKSMNLVCAKPGGSFYIYPNVKPWIEKVGASDEADFCDKLLKETGVVCLPGPAFGVQGKDHIRLSLVSSLDNMKEAMSRIKKWLEQGGGEI